MMTGFQDIRLYSSPNAGGVPSGWRIGIAALVLLLRLTAAGGVNAQISPPFDSPHDFRELAWSRGTSCTPCHSAHQGWGRDLSEVEYSLTGSPTIDSVDLGQPNGTSVLCLGCHDGTVPMDNFNGGEGATFMPARSTIGTDLATHHPVSFTYDAALAARDGALRRPGKSPSGLGSTIARDLLSEEGKVQCNSCHASHTGQLFKPVLGAVLCMTCHTGDRTSDHHIPGRFDPWNNCTMCHGEDLQGDPTRFGPACTNCHNDFSFPDPPPPGHHIPGREQPFENCTGCHGEDLQGGFGPSCFTCHGQLWEDPPPNQPPVADAGGPYVADLGLPFFVNGTGSFDPDGEISEYQWDFGDGQSGSGAVALHFYAATGQFTITLTVTDDRGDADAATTTVTVLVPNSPPQAVAGGPYAVQAGQPLQLDASASTDADGDLLSCQWDFGDGSPPSPMMDAPTVEHIYAEAGTYTVELLVSDGVNPRVAAYAQVEVSDPNGPTGGVWNLEFPLLGLRMTAIFEPWGEFLRVTMLDAAGSKSEGLGFRLGTVLVWSDASGAVFIGSQPDGANTLSGIAFNFVTPNTVWFGEAAP